jgi:transcription-repair coupling factor (superfamily II helicase)
LDIACQPAVEFRGRIQEWIAEVKRMRERGDTVVFVAATEGRAERTAELLGEYGLRGILIDRTDELLNVAVHIAVGQLSKGFRLPGAELQIIAEPDVFEEERTKVERKGDRHRSIAKTFLSDLRDLKVEDLVVHVDHGIGRFVGLKQIGVGDSMQEFMELRYFGEDKLFVPVERLELVQKYSGSAKPALDKLGGTSWERTKSRVKKAMRDMAEELLKLRRARPWLATRSARIRIGSGSSTMRSVGPDGRSGKRSPTSSATWNRRPRWTACCAATSGMGRPRWRCGPPSKR